MSNVMVRYQVKPERAAENERLVRAVYDELARAAPDGFRYATVVLDDGVSFVHIAILDGEENPLTSSSAFAAFQAGIADRCDEGPIPADATAIGNFRLLS